MRSETQNTKIYLTALFVAAFLVFFARGAEAAGGSGTYTSPVKDYGVAVSFENISWNQDTPANTSLTMQVRASNSNPPTGAWTTVTNGQPLSAFNGNQYFQYQAILSTTVDDAVPTLFDVTVQFVEPITGTLTSSAYNTTDTSNSVTNINWTAADTSPTERVRFQIRTAPNSGGVPNWGAGSGWCGPSNCSGGDYFTSPGAITNPTLTDNANDQWVQYLVTLDSAGVTAPTLQSATLTYFSPPMIYNTALSLSGGEVIRGVAASTVQTVLTVTRTGGAQEGADITHNAPAGVTLSFSPANLTPPPPAFCAPFASTCVSTITASASAAVAVGNYTITATVTPWDSGAPNAQTVQFILRVRGPLSYQLTSVSPSSGGAFQGAAVSPNPTITATYVTYTADGFSPAGGGESANFTNFTSASDPSLFSSTPAVGRIDVNFSGGTCTSTPLSATQTTCTRTLSVSTQPNTSVGVYTITFRDPRAVSSVTGSAPSAPLATYTLTVDGPFDFSMAYRDIPPCASGTSCSGSVEQSQTINVNVNLSSGNSVGEQVNLSVEGLPANTGFSQTPCIPSSPGNSPCLASLLISAQATAQSGPYNVRIYGTSQQTGVRHYLNFTLTITEGFTFDISLSAASGTAVRNGAVAQVTVDIARLTGTAQAVTLSVAGLSGSGVSLTYPNGNSCPPNCNRLVVFTATGSSVLDTYNLTITGTYGSLTSSESYTLSVKDPFNFSLALANPASASIPAGQSYTAFAIVGWVTGGGDVGDVVNLSSNYTPNPPPQGTLGVSFSPGGVVPCLGDPAWAPTGWCPGGYVASSTVDVIMLASASPPLTSDNYSVAVVGTAGPVLRTALFSLTVGTTLDFSLTFSPDNERVLSSDPDTSLITLTVTNTSPQDQPGSNAINFVVGDSPSYQLPVGVTVNPDPIAGCSLGPNTATDGGSADICPTTFRFNIDWATAMNGVYAIPIVGEGGGGVTTRRGPEYFTLKIGPLDLVQYQSPDVRPDLHQRPQITAVGWSPQTPFVGDRVDFTSTSTVYVTGQAGTAANTPANVSNAAFSWSAGGSGGSTPTWPATSITFPNSGRLNTTLNVADNTTGACFNNDSSGVDPGGCWCRFESLAPSAGINVSKPRPFFREIKP